MDFDVNKPHAADYALLAELGLPQWTAPLRAETLVGEVYPYPAEEEPRGRTKIHIFVSCAPAQFYRFVVERLSETEGYEGMEQVEISTGSGTLSRYWPMVMAVASNCFVVGQAKLLETH